MRLICPSCGAQYEVDESVIPDGGRDVQCSNCGHAWFQRSAMQLTAEAEGAEAEAPTPAAPETAAGSGTAEPGIAESGIAESGPEPSGASAEPAEEPTGEAATSSAERPRRTLDDAVKTVLREEAERETRARQSEGSAVETQPELGLAAAGGGAAAATDASATAAPPDRGARAGGDPHGFDDDALVSRASRRELLPDIEEINSTLRATSERGNEAAAFDAPETLGRRRSGFRMGFSTAILVAAVLLGLYGLAPTLQRAVPALEPALSSYVTGIDAGRLWLDARMRSLTQSLQGGASN